MTVLPSKIADQKCPQKYNPHVISVLYIPASNDTFLVKVSRGCIAFTQKLTFPLIVTLAYTG